MSKSSMSRRQFRRYLKDNPPLIKIGPYPGYTLVYVWEDRILRKRPIGAILIPKYDMRPLAGVHVGVTIPQNTPTMKINAKAHRKVALSVYGPDFSWQIDLGEGAFNERMLTADVDQINLLARKASS